MTEALVVFACFYVIHTQDGKTARSKAILFIAASILFFGALYYAIPMFFAMFGFWSANVTASGPCSDNSMMDRVVYVVGIPAVILFMCWFMLGKK